MLSRVLHAFFWFPYAVGLAVLTVLAGVVIALLALCNSVGLALLWSPKLVVRLVEKSWRWLMLDIERTIFVAPSRMRYFRQRQFVFGVFLFFSVVLSAFGTLEIGNLVAGGVGLKGRVLGEVTSALSKIELGKEHILNENLEFAQGEFGLAIEQFKQSRESLSQGNALFATLINILPAGRDAQRLLSAGEAGSQAALHATNFIKALSELKLNENGLEFEGNASLARALEALEQTKVSLASVRRATGEVNVSSIPADKQEAYTNMLTVLGNLESGMRVLGDAFHVLTTLVDGHKHVLVVMQNSNELRPTGGFMGTYGAFDLENGKVVSRKISSIYDLDGQLSKKYIPPLPVLAVNDRWFLRDSNWFASFPESAEVIKAFYEMEAKKTPDMVIAITPGLAESLLKLTGPLYLPVQDVTLDADNFVEVTQVETSLNYDRQANTPKQMLADFFPIFMQKITSLPAKDLPNLLVAVEHALASKDILLYSSDGRTSSILESLGFDGRIAQASRDYLNIVSSNLGGTKTDLAMKQEATLVSRIEMDGSIVNTLKIRRENPLPNMSGLENKVFLRVYVPYGSKLLSAKGFSYVDLDVAHDVGGETFTQVGDWEKHLIKEVGSGMLVGEESGKTFFGNWIVLKGGQSQTVELVYRLPFTLDVLDRYSLVLQKQPGAESYLLNHTLYFGTRRALWATDASLAGSQITKEFTVDRDRFYGLVLQAE